MIPVACLEACNTGLVKNGDIAVLVAIAKFADNDSKVCWPSIQKICETIGISRPTVISALDRLTQAGLIETVTLPNHGKGKATRRRLVFSEPSKRAKSREFQESHMMSQSTQKRAVTDRARGLKVLEEIKKNLKIPS